MPHVQDRAKAGTELGRFFIAAFLFSWLLWLPGVMLSYGWQVPGLLQGISMLAVFGPSGAAFWLTAQKEGRQDARVLWRRGWSLRFDKRWLYPAILLGPAIGGLALAVAGFVDGRLPVSDFWSRPWLLVPVFLYIFVLGGPLGEEFGWRGYALDRLQARYSPLIASLLLGVAHALWHLPLFFVRGSVQSQIPMWQFMLITSISSLLFTWLHNNTGGSIFIAMLFHAFSNMASAAMPYWQSESGRIAGFVLTLISAALLFRPYLHGKTKDKQEYP